MSHGLRRLKLLPPIGSLGFRNNEPLAVGADFQKCLGLDAQQIENGSINYKRKAVSVLGELLDHTRTPYLQCITIEGIAILVSPIPHIVSSFSFDYFIATQMAAPP